MQEIMYDGASWLFWPSESSEYVEYILAHFRLTIGKNL